MEWQLENLLRKRWVLSIHSFIHSINQSVNQSIELVIRELCTNLCSPSTGTQYWKYDSEKVIPVSSDYPKSLSTWEGVPDHIDAAFQWKNGKTFFFSGAQYYRFNDQRFTVEVDYPRPNGVWWFGCGADSTKDFVDSSVNTVHQDAVEESGDFSDTMNDATAADPLRETIYTVVREDKKLSMSGGGNNNNDVFYSQAQFSSASGMFLFSSSIFFVTFHLLIILIQKYWNIIVEFFSLVFFQFFYLLIFFTFAICTATLYLLRKHKNVCTPISLLFQFYTMLMVAFFYETRLLNNHSHVDSGKDRCLVFENWNKGDLFSARFVNLAHTTHQAYIRAS